MTLTDIANHYKLDKGTLIPLDGCDHGPRMNYTPIYEKSFSKCITTVKKVVEIGVENGNSLKMWSEYFPNAHIFGIDIANKSHFNTDRITCYQADQSYPEQIEKVVSSIGDIDVFIDDGSHNVEHQQTTLSKAFPYINKNGFYWIEDLCTSDYEVWKGKSLYGYSTDFEKGCSTVDVILNYKKTKMFKSSYLSEEENNRLTDQIKSDCLFELGTSNVYGFIKLALFRKCTNET